MMAAGLKISTIICVGANTSAKNSFGVPFEVATPFCRPAAAIRQRKDGNVEGKNRRAQQWIRHPRTLRLQTLLVFDVNVVNRLSKFTEDDHTNYLTLSEII
jgi:hypothetical protein